MPSERRRTGRGTHSPHAILGDAIQLRRADLQQRGEAVGQQLLQHRAMRHPEVRQRLGVHADATAQPLEGDMLLRTAAPVRGCCRSPCTVAYSHSAGRISRVGRRMPGPALHRLDRAVQLRKVQPFDEAPEQAHPMVVRNQGLEVDGTKPATCRRSRRAKPRRRATLARCGADWIGSSSISAAPSSCAIPTPP